MRLMRRLCLTFLTSFLWSLLAGQSVAQDANTDPARTESELRRLMAAMAEQQKAMADQQRAMTEQQKQIAEQEREIDRLRQQLSTMDRPVSASDAGKQARMVNAALTGPNDASATATAVKSDMPDDHPKDSPLSFHIGGADFTPGGFLDLTAFWRSTNAGTGYGTNFFSIPYANTFPGQITETRFTAENSRLSLKAADRFKGTDVIGYVETDFHGNDPANLNVSSNSSTMRLRQYWVDVKTGKWEVLGGQAWSWLTPNRVGLSAAPSDVFYSLAMDANYQVGLTWTRAPQVRGIFHPNSHWGLGVALENPDQFIGQNQ